MNVTPLYQLFRLLGTTANNIAQIYFMFIGIDLLCVYLTWQFFPEFSHLSLEEIDLVFETPGVNPVNMSKKLDAAKRAKRKADNEAVNI